MLIVDSQVHIWKNGTPVVIHRQISQYTKDDLLKEMKEGGVDAVVLCPPSWDPQANEISIEAAAAHPDRFCVLGNFDPKDPASPARVEKWREQPGMVGLRFAFLRKGEDTWLTDGTMDWVWAAAEKQNLPVALLIWLMVIPMLLKIDFASLRRVGQHWRGVGVTVLVNWAVKPFSMAALGWLFIGWLFRPYLPADQVASYIAGLIILAAAPCTAMVFVWSNLTKGEPHFTLSQVALNDTIMVVAFAPIVGLLLGLSAITVPWGTLVLSVVLYIVLPVIVAQVVRRSVLASSGQAALDRVLKPLGPISLVALLATLVLLFGFQGEQILAQPLVIAMLAVPILIQVYFNAGLAYILNRMAGEQHCVAGPSALIGASNFFELAVAAAISRFGFNSGAALATVVGVLIEVPVMLTVVHIVNRSKGWYERGAASRADLKPASREA